MGFSSPPLGELYAAALFKKTLVIILRTVYHIFIIYEDGGINGKKL